MRKILLKTYMNERYILMNEITMTSNDVYYRLLNEEVLQFDDEHPLFKTAKNKNEERIIFVNMVLDSNGHSSMTSEEEQWMLTNYSLMIRES